MDDANVLSITELTLQLKQLVEEGIGDVGVIGEISNCSRASSGHVYLTLKDESAQLRAVIWRGVAERLKFELQDGLEVVAGGRVEVYAARGSYQLIVRWMQPRGVGALELAFRQLQQKLAAEGLFEPQRKRPLPAFPKRIALITSPTGAAVRDMLQVITRRWPPADIVILPVPVQGDGAAPQIAAAIDQVHRIPDVDVVIVGRGGGSLEDLWAFNEEVVARAIAGCEIPVVSAVGHEVDVSISDLVADRRALTPSEAGELVVPSLIEVNSLLQAASDRLRSVLRQRAERARAELTAIESRRLWQEPTELIRPRAEMVDELERRLVDGCSRQLERHRQSVQLVSTALDALSPLKVIARGYSATMDSESGQVINSARFVQPGQQLTTRLSDGSIQSTVQAVELSEGGRPRAEK